MRNSLLLVPLALLSTGRVLAAPETYAVEPSHTYPRFEYSHFGLSTQIHRFNKTTGIIMLDRAARSGAVDISIDARSIDSGYAVFNEHLQGEEFFDTARYPTITYKSTAVRFEGDKPAVVEGLLTIKGITKAVSLTVTSFHAMPHPILKKDAIGANAVARIKRSDFKASKLTPHVSDEINLSIAVEAIKL